MLAANPADFALSGDAAPAPRGESEPSSVPAAACCRPPYSHALRFPRDRTAVIASDRSAASRSAVAVCSSRQEWNIQTELATQLKPLCPDTRFLCMRSAMVVDSCPSASDLQTNLQLRQWGVCRSQVPSEQMSRAHSEKFSSHCASAANVPHRSCQTRPRAPYCSQRVQRSDHLVTAKRGRRQALPCRMPAERSAHGSAARPHRTSVKAFRAIT